MGFVRWCLRTQQRTNHAQSLCSFINGAKSRVYEVGFRAVLGGLKDYLPSFFSSGKQKIPLDYAEYGLIIAKGNNLRKGCVYSILMLAGDYSLYLGGT